jgi:serine/threonine protein kinase
LHRSEDGPSPPRLTCGTHLGPYRVETLIDKGGMGEVYLARDTSLGRDVALKVLPSAALGQSRRLTRFDHEARALAALDHPNIGAIHAVIDEAGVRGLVLEFIHGPTLAARLLHGPLTLPETLSIARQIASGLAAAHASGIVHRDLKPANLKITPEGVVKVLDFGLAKLSEPGERSGDAPTMSFDGSDDGRVTGTTAYMSPEQARGKLVDRRTDIWAFGCVLFEMLTGRRAFAGDTTSDTIAAILDRQPDLTTLPRRTPAGLRRLLVRCLEKDPARRLQDIADAHFDLEDALADSTRGVPQYLTGVLRARPRPWWLAIGVALLLAGAAAGAVCTWLVASAAIENARAHRHDDGRDVYLQVRPLDCP